MTKQFIIRQIADGSYQILRQANDEWGNPIPYHFVYDVAATQKEAEDKASKASM